MPAELRPIQALRLWHDVTFDLVLDAQPDLSARQMAVLLTVYLEPPPHTVRGLAKKLGVTKPAITRALDTMGRMGLLSRRRDDADRRNVVVQRTLAGALAVEKLGDAIVARHRALPL
jgi:DNA-binding MarR family transcriptional regulator